MFTFVFNSRLLLLMPLKLSFWHNCLSSPSDVFLVSFSIVNANVTDSDAETGGFGQPLTCLFASLLFSFSLYLLFLLLFSMIISSVRHFSTNFPFSYFSLSFFFYKNVSNSSRRFYSFYYWRHVFVINWDCPQTFSVIKELLFIFHCLFLLTMPFSLS